MSKDRNRFGSPGLRLVQLYILLMSTGHPFSLTRLSNMLSCSRQTILRMIEQINLIPQVECNTWLDKNERFFQIVVQSPEASLVFNADTLRHLTLCRDIVAHLLPEAFKKELHNTLDAATDELSGRIAKSSSFAEPWVKGHIDYTPYQVVIEDIQNAMTGRRLCRVLYQSRSSGERMKYLVAPLLIIAYREALYLHCRLYNTPTQPTDKFRTLAIHRIKTLRMEAATYADMPDKKHIPDFGFPFHEPIQIKVAFWGGAASYVEERNWSPGQRITKRKDGALVLTFMATSRIEVIAWVLSFGPDAEILEPEDLRAEMRKRASLIAARYGNLKKDARE